MKLWTGRISKQTDKAAESFNSSISFDGRMYEEDIRGSIAHARMLGKAGIISGEDADAILNGLSEILKELKDGSLSLDPKAEDIHSFMEAELTRRIGDAGKRLHTGRSRNDQTALDLRLYLRGESEKTVSLLKELVLFLCEASEKYSEAVMPGYTHLQRAQPIVFGHHLSAYAEMFLRDLSRVRDAVKRMNYSPLGCAALAGTAYSLDREQTAEELSFSGLCENSLDGVSDRDFCIELTGCLSIIAMHLSRFCEELILWSSHEFKFIELDDSFSTGSSIMPQKKNPDIAELIRGKTGRVYGDLITLLTVMKGLPLSYNKDMQEDKEAVFDAFDTVNACLSLLKPMLASAKVLTENMRRAASEGFINATDCADFLVGKGLPFRDAYKTVGELVSLCLKEGFSLETLPLSEYKKACSLFDEGVYEAVSLERCISLRKCRGGPAPQNVRRRAKEIRREIEELLENA